MEISDVERQISEFIQQRIDVLEKITGQNVLRVELKAPADVIFSETLQTRVNWSELQVKVVLDATT